MTKRSNIILIGMPGSGKSTLGRRLAASRGMQFIDTDLLIERVENQPIQHIVNHRGVAHLRETEAAILRGLEIQGHVVATGGSAVCSREAVSHLGNIGCRVYLEISMQTLIRRVDNSGERGLAKMPGHSLQRLYRDRLPLYQQAADLLIENDWPLTATRLSEINQRIDEIQHEL